MRKTGKIGHIFGTCDACGETDVPLTFWPPTGEWLDPVHLAQRKRIPKAKERIKSKEAEDAFWDDIKTHQG